MKFTAASRDSIIIETIGRTARGLLLHVSRVHSPAIRSAEISIPGEAAECVPVRLIEDGARPVAIAADVRHAGHRGNRGGDRRPAPRSTSVRVERLGPHRRQVSDAGVLPEIFARDLRFERDPRMRHLPEQRMEGLARLEVDWAILDLKDDVIPKFAIEWPELVIGLHRPVLARVPIDERSPEDGAAVWSQRVGDDVGALGVSPAIVLRSGLAFRIGFDDEAAEIRNEAIDFVGLRLPPCLNCGIERVGCSQSAESRWDC